MPKSPKPIKNYEYDFSRILNRYHYDDRIEAIREEVLSNRIKKSRDRAINSFMLSLISIIHYLEEDGKSIGLKPNEDFYGISDSDLIKWFESYTGKETIYSYLYKLFRLRYLTRIKIGNEYYYRVNDTDFICHGGIYLFKYGKVNSISNMFLGYCDIAHYCNHKPNKCIFHNIFAKKMQSITGLQLREIKETDIYKDLKSRVKRNMKHHLNLTYLKSTLKASGIDVGKLGDFEIYHYYDLIDKRKKAGEEIDDIMEEIEDVTNIRKNMRRSSRNPPPNYLRVIQRADSETIRSINDEWKFNPLMMGIINVINLGREDAKKLGIKFPGFSTYQIKQMLEGLWISGEAVHESLYRLQKLGIIRKIYYEDEEGPKNAKNDFYFDLNDDRFLCIGGIYTFYYPASRNEFKVFNGVCPNHHFCATSCPSECTLVNYIKGAGKIISDDAEREFPIVSYLTEKMRGWQKDYENFETYRENLSTVIKHNIDYVSDEIRRKLLDRGIRKIPNITVDLVLDHLTDMEILYYGKSITVQYFVNLEFKKIIDLVCESAFLSIMRDLRKKIKKTRGRKSEVKVETRMNVYDLLREIFNEDISKKIQLF